VSDDSGMREIPKLTQPISKRPAPAPLDMSVHHLGEQQPFGLQSRYLFLSLVEGQRKVLR